MLRVRGGHSGSSGPLSQFGGLVKKRWINGSAPVLAW
jgi:hypothetical protein